MEKLPVLEQELGQRRAGRSFFTTMKFVQKFPDSKTRLLWFCKSTKKARLRLYQVKNGYEKSNKFWGFQKSNRGYVSVAAVFCLSFPADCSSPLLSSLRYCPLAV